MNRTIGDIVERDAYTCRYDQGLRRGDGPVQRTGHERARGDRRGSPCGGIYQRRRHHEGGRRAEDALHLRRRVLQHGAVRQRVLRGEPRAQAPQRHGAGRAAGAVRHGRPDHRRDRRRAGEEEVQEGAGHRQGRQAHRHGAPRHHHPLPVRCAVRRGRADAVTPGLILAASTASVRVEKGERHEGDRRRMPRADGAARQPIRRRARGYGAGGRRRPVRDATTPAATSARWWPRTRSGHPRGGRPLVRHRRVRRAHRRFQRGAVPRNARLGRGAWESSRHGQHGVLARTVRTIRSGRPAHPDHLQMQHLEDGERDAEVGGDRGAGARGRDGYRDHRPARPRSVWMRPAAPPSSSAT